LKRFYATVAGLTLVFGAPVAGAADTTASSGAAAPAAGVAAASGPVAAHRVGDAFDYTIRGSMLQAISARSPLFGTVHQAGTPTELQGSEHVAVQQVSDQDITLNRSGQIVAVVSDKSVKSAGRGLTVVRGNGSIAHDTGNLGGVFLLPLPFLGDRVMNAGANITVGARWTDKLGTKLYGMTARPMMTYEITAQHLTLGLDVFEIVAEGVAPMREPVVSNFGESLGYATGVAHVTIRGQYDYVHHRMLSMEVEVHDQLKLTGPHKRSLGTVGDAQHYVLELDPASIAASSTHQDSETIDAPVTR